MDEDLNIGENRKAYLNVLHVCTGEFQKYSTIIKERIIAVSSVQSNNI